MSSEQHMSLRLAKGFNKFIPLPDQQTWRVHQSDVLHRGSALSFLRTKSSFFLLPDAVSELKMRNITVTRHGYMVIYETTKTGLIVDVRGALNIFCTADKFKYMRLSGSGEYARCHIKIRLARGNVHLFVKGEDIHKWTCAVMRAMAVVPKASGLLKTSEANVETSEDVMTALEMFEEAPELTELPELPELSETVCETCWEGYEDSEDSEVVTAIEDFSQHMDRPPVSVRSLREKLAKSLVIRPKEEVLAEQLRTSRTPSFVSELFVDAPAVFSDETTVVLEPINEEEEMEKEQKEWWMRSLRC